MAMVDVLWAVNEAELDSKLTVDVVVVDASTVDVSVKVVVPILLPEV